MNENIIKITNHVVLIAQADKLEELLNALEICATSTRNEAGCEYHEIIQSIANPDQITLIEKFSNYPAFKAHFDNPDIRDFIDKKQHELLLSMSNSVHITKVNCMGTRKVDDSSALSFRGEISA